MRYLQYFLLVSIFVFGGALLGANSVNAASPYDKLVYPDSASEKPEIYRINDQDNPVYVDFLANDYVAQCGQNYLDAWNYTKNTELNYSIQLYTSTYNNGNQKPSSIFLTFTADSIDDNTEFYRQSTDRTLRLSQPTQLNTYVVNVRFKQPHESNPNTISVTCKNSNWNSGTFPHGNGLQIAMSSYDINTNSCNPKYRFSSSGTTINGCYTLIPIVSKYPITYPSGYQGALINTIPPRPVETILEVPKITITNVYDSLVTFSDSNFFTTDQTYPFLCEGVFAPTINIEIWRKSILEDVLITSFSSTASNQLTYQLSKNADESRNYEIVSWYDCSNGTIFPNASTTPFSVNRSGFLEQDIFDNCMTPDFPFLNVPGCINNINRTIQLLYFGKIVLPQWSFDPACHNLNILDDWLQLPNGYQVCPQIPNFVRQITTPFIAFLLGLVTVGFITKVRKDFDG